MENLVLYYTFIESCRNKKYECTHKHHIIPKFMGGKKEKHNEILLGYEDHQLAHIILAKCFTEGSRNYIYNINAAAKLNAWVDNIKQNIDLKELCRNLKLGKTYEELYGEEKAKEIKDKLSLHFTKYFSDENNLKDFTEKINIANNKFKGITWEMKYGKDEADIKKVNASNLMKKTQELWKLDPIIQEKRKKTYKNTLENRTNEEIKQISENISKGVLLYWKDLKLDKNVEKLKERNKKISDKTKGMKRSEEQKIHMKENRPDFSGKNNPMYGKKHKSSTCLKIGIANKGNNKCGGRLGKTFSSFKFYKNEIFIYEAHGQRDSKEFCNNNQLNYQALCKGPNIYNEWNCIRNKKIKNETVS